MALNTRRTQLKDPRRESRIFAARSAVAVVVVALLLGLLLTQYFTLQVLDHLAYAVQSDRNRLQLQPLPPKRGLIYDRNGVLLAENRPSFLLSIVRERVDDLEQTLAQLQELVIIEDRDLEKFHQRLQRRRPYEAVPLRFRLNEEERATLAVNRHRLPGVVVDASLVRHYPQGPLFSHAIGYVGRISERELTTLDEDAYRGTFHTGKVGIEKFYEDILLGEVGYQNVETNAHGRVLRVLERNNPRPGSDLRLHLDSRLQKSAFAALGERRGAVVAIEPQTGGVLAMVSTPGFDTNLFVNGISVRDYAALRDSPDVPLFNRAVQGQYPPGSTIKPMMSMAGLESGVFNLDTMVADPGWYSLPGDSRRYRDWILRIRGTGHAPEVGLRMAIAESCDVYYYDLARKLTIDRMAEYLAPYALGSRTGIDTTNERPGVLPSTRWKREARGQPWYPGETLSAGIGQGYMLATPLQLAVATTVMASRGESRTPRLLSAIDGESIAAPARQSLVAETAHWQAVHEGMVDVVHGKRGTAASISRGLQYQMAGKTGTAQVIGIAQDEIYDEEQVAERHRHHGWFIAFAPSEDPTIAVAVLVENGGGAKAATPVARAVIDTWLGEEVGTL